jgi:hypothetical protein
VEGILRGHFRTAEGRLDAAVIGLLKGELR